MTPFFSILQTAQSYKATLIAVSKNQEASAIQKLIDEGATDIAFNRVQEAEEKFPLLHGNLKKHLIGHLQKNKVNKAIALFDMIQSVDSLALAQKIEKACQQQKKEIPLLLQVNTAQDEEKFGFSEKELLEALPQLSLLQCGKIQGLMMVGRHGISKEKTKEDFLRTQILFKKIQDQNIFLHFTELSMGMSEDYEIALCAGATMIRVGRKLFSQEV